LYASRASIELGLEVRQSHKTYIAPPAFARIVDWMRSNDLTPEQAEALVRNIRPMLGYLNQLVKRMNKRRFPSDDPLFRSTLTAYDAIHELHVQVHYLSCTSGVRQVPKDRKVDPPSSSTHPQ
jgi:hypothetical protein